MDGLMDCLMVISWLEGNLRGGFGNQLDLAGVALKKLGVLNFQAKICKKDPIQTGCKDCRQHSVMPTLKSGIHLLYRVP